MTDAVLYVPFVTLSTQENAKLQNQVLKELLVEIDSDQKSNT